jgi:hypothetical protein
MLLLGGGLQCLELVTQFFVLGLLVGDRENFFRKRKLRLQTQECNLYYYEAS